MGHPPSLLKCSVSGCQRRYSAKGFCKLHYVRWQRHGNPTTILKVRGRKCEKADCAEKHLARGLCSKHYYQLKDVRRANNQKTAVWRKARRKQDPEWRSEQNRKCGEYRQRRIEKDPEFYVKHRARSKDYYYRNHEARKLANRNYLRLMRQDPSWCEEKREYERKWLHTPKGKAKLQKWCKKRIEALRNATPLWVDSIAIQAIYDKCPDGWQTDHIIPLLGKNVCGLHVPWNLQYLPKKENMSKGNRIRQQDWAIINEFVGVTVT